MSKTIAVAAVQMDAEFGNKPQNLSRAEGYIQQAVKQGAQLVLLPELLANGYGITEEVWDGAEPIDGPTVAWLKRLAKQHSIYLGTSFLEAEGEDFFNSFVLTTPSGEIAGRVRKTPAPSVESYFYKSGSDSHIIETELGRIGVSICYEVLLHQQLHELWEGDIDLCLQPSASGRPKPFIPGDQMRLERAWLNCREIYYQSLGVPVINANRVGKLEGQLPSVMGYLRSSFMGGSYIGDYDGTIHKQMDTRSQQGVIVDTITLGKKYRSATPPKEYGNGWAVPMPWFAFLYPMTQPWGEKAYQASEKRKDAAQHQQQSCNVSG